MSTTLFVQRVLTFGLELPEESFVTCTSCEDYDLCIPCHTDNKHGHHPKHGFTPAVEDTVLEPIAQALLAPGRNSGHNAICDGCDKVRSIPSNSTRQIANMTQYIYGVRHKCLDCPDWDFCSGCIVNSSFIHPRHRFVPIYEPLHDIAALSRSYSSKATPPRNILRWSYLHSSHGYSDIHQG